jgi:hypothetical protein
MADLFEHRAARNEALFRSVNEEIEKLGLAAGSQPEERQIGFVCECSNGSCIETVQLTVPEYEEVRSGSRWFAILPGHLNPEIEHVVQTHPHYLIVEKDTPAATRIADDTDPRD